MPSALNVSSATALGSAVRDGQPVNLVDPGYADLLPLDDVRADAADFERELLRLGIRHEAKAIPFDPRPVLMSSARYDAIAERFGRLFGLLERSIDLYVADPAVREFFDLAPRHDRLIRTAVSYQPRIQVCRYDFTLDPAGTPLIYEFNTHCPAAATYAVHYARLAAGSRVQARLDALGLRRRQLPLEDSGSFAVAMRESAVANGRPVTGVGVLNSRYLTMNTELDSIVEQFDALGLPAVRGHVEDLSYRDGQLWLAGQPVNLTYNKFDDSSGPDAFECAFSRTTEEVRAYLRAYSDGAVHAVNSFPAMYLTEQKSALAFLHSDLFAQHATEQERALIAEIVPYTVVIRRAGADLLDRLTEQRSRFVLKKSLDTRGRSMVVGRSVSDQDWRQALAQARAALPGEDWVAQRLAAPLESNLNPLDGGEPVPVFSTLACFLFAGRPAGLIVRTSVEETTNVGRVGFMQPPTVIAG
jgi:uncharacterized circularly permuted ATP-grasp superfamily protein